MLKDGTLSLVEAQKRDLSDKLMTKVYPSTFYRMSQSHRIEEAISQVIGWNKLLPVAKVRWHGARFLYTWQLLEHPHRDYQAVHGFGLTSFTEFYIFMNSVFEVEWPENGLRFDDDLLAELNRLGDQEQTAAQSSK